MSDDEESQILREALQGYVDEEIEVVHYAMREYGFEDSWRKGFRWIRRRFPSDHPKDRTGTFNVVAVTPTRVLVFNAKPEAPFVAVRRQIAEWPRGALRVAWKAETVSAHYNSGNSSSRTRIVRATFSWDGEERPLVLDFPKGKRTKAIIDAIDGG